MKVNVAERVLFNFNLTAHQTDHSQDLATLQSYSGKLATVNIVEPIQSPKGDMCRIETDDGVDLWVWSTELTLVAGAGPMDRGEVKQPQFERPRVGEQLNLF